MVIGRSDSEGLGGAPLHQAGQWPAAGSARVLVFTTLFPNPAQPRLGIFVRDRVAAVAEHCPTRIVAPVLQRFTGRRLDQSSIAAIPVRERHAGLEVCHPRFTTAPGIGRFADGLLLFMQTLPLVRRLYRDSPFDLIDAHYAFPDGAAAVLLGRQLGIPVCVTVRGGDIDVLPQFRLRRRLIRWTLQRADRLFAVSEHLARGVATLGVDAPVRVVPNGIDPQTFHPVDRRRARQRLGIADDAELLICVANLTAEKGHHILIEALGMLARNGASVPHLAIIGSDQWGGRHYGQHIERRVAALGLGSRVRMVGAVPQGELAGWYSAADVVVLPTFREGCPNVIREAQACGAPVVASRVGGVPELITSDASGLLVRPGDAEDLAQGLGDALRRGWDREAIATAAAQRTWRSVALTITREFSSLLSRRALRPAADGSDAAFALR